MMTSSNSFPSQVRLDPGKDTRYSQSILDLQRAPQVKNCWEEDQVGFPIVVGVIDGRTVYGCYVN